MATILGIDFGGTSTDAVLLNAGGVRAKAKVATTEDVYSGIKHAICQIADQHGPGALFQAYLCDAMCKNSLWGCCHTGGLVSPARLLEVPRNFTTALGGTCALRCHTDLQICSRSRWYAWERRTSSTPSFAGKTSPLWPCCACAVLPHVPCLRCAIFHQASALEADGTCCQVDAPSIAIQSVQLREYLNPFATFCNPIRFRCL